MSDEPIFYESTPEILNSYYLELASQSKDDCEICNTYRKLFSALAKYTGISSLNDQSFTLYMLDEFREHLMKAHTGVNFIFGKHDKMLHTIMAKPTKEATIKSVNKRNKKSNNIDDALKDFCKNCGEEIWFDSVPGPALYTDWRHIRTGKRKCDPNIVGEGLPEYAEPEGSDY
jgi:hypothetical protein